MKYLRNIKPYEPVKMNEYVNHSGNQIASKAMIDNEHTEIRFFSFAEGENIDKEYYQMETIFFVLEGKIKISYNKSDEVFVNAGEMIALETDIDYGVTAITDVKLFNVLVKN